MIRQATRSDINAMLGLLHQLFTLEVDFRFSAERQKKGLELLLASPSARIMVAEDQGEVVGMVTAQVVISTAEGEPSLLIEDLVVIPPRQHQGIAGTLLLALDEWGAGMGARRMQLLADCTNTPALDFYRHKGWHTTQLICLRKYATKGILT
ncbi:MAG: GNAT family N-acetyltransferase [Pseudomonadota bacterium]